MSAGWKIQIWKQVEHGALKKKKLCWGPRTAVKLGHKVAGNELLIKWNTPNSLIRGSVSDMRHLLNSQISPSKSRVSFIKLTAVDSRQIEPVLKLSICDCAVQGRSFGSNWLGGMPSAINVHGLNLTPTWYGSHCAKARGYLRYLFHHCLINLLIAVSSPLPLFNYPPACAAFTPRLQPRRSPLSALRPVASLCEINFRWLYSKRHSNYFFLTTESGDRDGTVPVSRFSLAARFRRCFPAARWPLR